MSPSEYLHGYHTSLIRSFQTRTADNSAAFLLPHLTPGMSLLDVGCGPGTITAGLAQHVAPGRVVGLERDASMQSFVASAATSQAVVIEYVVGDVYHLDYPDDTYDIVFAHQVLQHLSDPVAALREMRRICKPGGLVAARDGSHETCTWAPESPSLDLWLELYFAVGRGNGTTPDAGRRLLAWANASGFDEVVFSASTEYLADSDRRQRWADMWQDRMLNSDLATQALERGLLSFRY